MEAERILAHVRPLILVVDGFGTMVDVRGGAGNLFGYRPGEMVGRNVLDYVAARERTSVATYFVEERGRPARPTRSVPTPMPFRTVVIDAHGGEHDVDVIPAGQLDEDDELEGWVVVLVPLALQSSPTRSLNAELLGLPRSEVRRRLTEELEYPSPSVKLLWFHVDLVSSSRPELTAPRNDPGIGQYLARALASGWAPWELPAGVGRRSPIGTVLVGARVPPVELPPPVRDALAVIDANRLSWIPVDLDGEVVGGYLEVGHLPPGDENAVKTNALARMRGLIEATRLLSSRWRDQDRLVLAATRDSLTGLSNRDSFRDALAGADHAFAVLYIDVDRFKEVNDRWGHAVGDRVLTVLAERIQRTCRPGDVVARFGGDEFVVLLENVDRATARRVGERIVEVASAPLELTHGPQRVTLSVGLAPAASGLDPIDVADRAMMLAKRQGRDRLVSA